MENRPINQYCAIFSLPEKIINRIYYENKDVFVKYTTHIPSKKSKLNLKIGLKVLFYQSRSNKQIVGESEIENISFQLPKNVYDKYKNGLMLDRSDFKKYTTRRDSKKLMILELKKIKRYAKPKYLKKPLNMGWVYVTPENVRDWFIDSQSVLKVKK